MWCVDRLPFPPRNRLNCSSSFNPRCDNCLLLLPLVRLAIQVPGLFVDDPYSTSERWRDCLGCCDRCKGSFLNGINYVSLMGSGKIYCQLYIFPRSRFRPIASQVVFICLSEDNTSISSIRSGASLIHEEESFLKLWRNV